MTADEALAGAARRLVADLMPIAILVAGLEPDRMIAALAEAGADAEPLAPATTGPFDLAILRADPSFFAAPIAQSWLKSLIELSDRIVFQPMPGPSGIDMEALTAWFEYFAENGYQPVVEYESGYLGDGAFLVDRNATAAETDLAGFTERVSQAGALHTSTVRIAELETELAGLPALKAELAAQTAGAAGAQAELAILRDLLQAAETRATRLQEEATAWSPLRDWVRAAVARAPQAATPVRRPGRLARLLGRRQHNAPDTGPNAALGQATLIRASKLFDAAWYIACHPDLAETGADPALHYAQTGAAAGYDPGPWFDTARYMREYPGFDPAATNPLLHAIEHGQEDALLRQARSS